MRTCRPIPKGMFICQYIGEVITEAEAERRGEEYDRKVPTLPHCIALHSNSNLRELPISSI